MKVKVCGSQRYFVQLSTDFVISRLGGATRRERMATRRRNASGKEWGRRGMPSPPPEMHFVSPSRPPLHYDYTNIKVYSVFTACREVSGSNIEFIIRVCIEKPRVFILRLLFLSVNALRYMLTLSSQPNRYTLYQHLNILASTSSN